MNHPSNPKKNPHDSELKKLGLVFVIPTILVGYVLAGFGVGYLVCRQFHLPQEVIILTTLVGLVLGFVQLYSFFKKDL